MRGSCVECWRVLIGTCTDIMHHMTLFEVVTGECQSCAQAHPSTMRPVWALVVFSALSAARAAFFTTNYTDGDHLLLYDNVTRLEWLRTTQTHHLTPATIFSQFVPGKAFNGWRCVLSDDTIT